MHSGAVILLSWSLDPDYRVVRFIEIINNTRGGIEGEIWEHGNGGKLKSRMNTTQFLGYTWNQKNLKQESQNWVFYMFCMSLLQTFPPFEFKRFI